MDAIPRAPRRDTPVLIDDAIHAVADIEQARADADHHRRLAAFHVSKATKLERTIDGRVVVAAEALARIRARRQQLVARTRPPDQPASASAEAPAALAPELGMAA